MGMTRGTVWYITCDTCGQGLPKTLRSDEHAAIEAAFKEGCKKSGEKWYCPSCGLPKSANPFSLGNILDTIEKITGDKK